MKKNTIILAGLFIVLLIVAYVVMQKPGEQSASSASSGFLASIDSASVDKLEIKTPTSFLVLEKQGADWHIIQPVNFKANQATVAQTLHQLKNIEVKSVVSSKPEKHSVFQVDQNGTEIKVYEKGAEKLAFILGKMAASYTESYARRLNSDEVILVQGAYGYIFTRPVKEWRDKTINACPRETIKEVYYQFDDTTFSIAFKDSIWYVGKEKAQQTVVENILSSLSNFQADDFIDSTISPKIMATILLNNNRIQFSFNKTTNKYAVLSSQSPQWFVLEPYRANQVLKRKKEIVE